MLDPFKESDYTYKKSLDLFVHNMVSLHVYIHLWGWEKGGGYVQP